MKLPIYTAVDPDQPTTCPLCGARTDWIGNERSQIHACLDSACGYRFGLEVEPEPEKLRK